MAHSGYHGRPVSAVDHENYEELTCYCMGIPTAVVKEVIRKYHCTEVEHVSDQCTAATGCGTCAREIDLLIEAAGTRTAAPGDPLTTP